MRVLVTGSRNWTDREAVVSALGVIDRFASALVHPAPPVLVHGDQGEVDEDGQWIRGLDRLAAEVAVGFGWGVEPHPADWDEWGSAAGPIRNQEMVRLGADLCLGFPLEGSRGTWDTVRKAGLAGIPVVLFSTEQPWLSRIAQVLRETHPSLT